MADSTNTTENNVKTVAGFLFGRRDIYSSVEELTEDNVIDEVNSALVYHLQNVAEEEYLYWYRRGLQPVLNRKKDRNSFINNKVVCNIADQVTTFKSGYLLQEPAFYTSRKAKAQRKVDKLNEQLYKSGKQTADNKLADWFHMCGKATLFVEPADEEDLAVRAYAIDPRSGFVVYSLRPGNKPLFGVNMVISDRQILVDVFTKDRVFKLSGASTSKTATAYPMYDATVSNIDDIKPNRLAPYIPIIEYRYNSVNMASFESALPLCDSYSLILSNRCDGVEQFIQSIAIAVNCQFEEGTTADKIKEAGMIALTSIGENKADFKILSEELNQEQTQVLADNIYNHILEICALPSSARSGRGTYDSTGAAAIFNNGWEQAASCARNTEDLFKESNRYFDQILVSVLKQKKMLDISIDDFELNFVRNETSGVQSKAQALNTMLASGLHPALALAKSGISNDPVADLKLSEKYMKMIWGDPDVQQDAQPTGEAPAAEIEKTQPDPARGEAEIVEVATDEDREAEEV